MKRNTTCLLLLLFPAVWSVTGCSNSHDAIDTEGAGERIELTVSGGGLTTATRATATNIVPFNATVLATTRQGDYSGLSGNYEWTKKVQVGADRSVTFLNPTNPEPNYPANGDYIYLTAIAPKPTKIDNNEVSYTLDGTQDLLYAQEIEGNKWDNYRFAGNPISSNDKPLAFEHLLTQLQFKAVKKSDDGLPVTITKISVKNVKTEVIVRLSDRIINYDGSNEVSLSLNPGITVDKTTHVNIGNLLLPPLENATYIIDVETSVGKFTDVSLEFGADTDPSKHFQPGVSHEITLNIEDTSLGITTVSVASWIPTEGGKIDLIEN